MSVQRPICGGAHGRVRGDDLWPRVMVGQWGVGEPEGALRGPIDVSVPAPQQRKARRTGAVVTKGNERSSSSLRTPCIRAVMASASRSSHLYPGSDRHSRDATGGFLFAAAPKEAGQSVRPVRIGQSSRAGLADIARREDEDPPGLKGSALGPCAPLGGG
jgi:hypothetical protein